MKILKVDKDKVQVELTRDEMNIVVSLTDISTQEFWQNINDCTILLGPSSKIQSIPLVPLNPKDKKE